MEPTTCRISPHLILNRFSTDVISITAKKFSGDGPDEKLRGHVIEEI